MHAHVHTLQDHHSYLKPIDGTTVDQRWKFSDPIAKVVAYRRHDYYDVQLIARYLNEKIEQSHRASVRLHRSIPLSVYLPHLLAYLGQFISGEYIRYLQHIVYTHRYRTHAWICTYVSRDVCTSLAYLSGIKHIAYIFEETLLLNLSIGKEECRVKIAGGNTFQNVFHVIVPSLNPVLLSDLNLEHVVVAYMGCQSSQRLSSRTADPDKESVVARLLDNTRDTRQMFDGESVVYFIKFHTFSLSLQ